MSLTVTSTALEKVLEDYRIVLTGSDTAPAQPSSSSTKAKANPPDWPTDNFRIPDYRPVNKNLDIEQRPNGSSFPEKAFLTIMFTGVFINASLAKLWRAIGESFFPGLFIYAIGGEW